MDTPCPPGRYIWGGNAGSHGIKFETDLAYALFVYGSLRHIPFRLATEMKEAGKWEDVVLFREDLKEVWLFQAKHCSGSRTSDASIKYGDLFPDNCEGRKEFALHMYLQSMLDARKKPAFAGYTMRFFIFTNKSLGDRAMVQELMQVETRNVDELLQWSGTSDCYQGFRPNDTEIDRLLDAMNVELIAVRDAVVGLLENGKVSNVLVKYKTPLKSLMRLSGGRLQFLEDSSSSGSNTTLKWFFDELKNHFSWNKNGEIKSKSGKTMNNAITQQIKALFEGNSRDKCFPTVVGEQDVRDFFAAFVLCLRQPEPKTVVDDGICSWMRQWITPNDLGKFSEAQKTLPRTKFYDSFKSWHEASEKEKTFLSFDEEGKRCIEAVTAELRQHVSMQKKQIDTFYVPRYLEEVGNSKECQVSDWEFIQNIAKQRSYVLIGEPGMGKTTWMQYISFELQKITDWQVYLIYLNKLHNKVMAQHRNVFELLKSELSELNLNALQITLGTGERKLMILLDGFDELAQSCHDFMIKIIQELLSHKNAHLIVSGRKHKQEILEKVLQTKAICLVPFKYEEQIQFLRMFWGISNDNQLVWQKFRNFSINLIEKLHNNIKAEHFCFTGLPLMIRMLAEIYSGDFEKFITSDQEEEDQEMLSAKKLSLLNLFEQFVRMSLNMQLKKILNQDAYSTLHTKLDRCFKINMEQFDFEHQLAAIRHLTIKELQNCVQTQNYSQTTLDHMRKLHDGDDKSLLITVSKDNQVEFVHRSYAEYFVAKYLYNRVTECESALLKILQRQKVVQIFFFMMVEENFDASSQQMTAVGNICSRDSDVAFMACSGDHVKIVRKLLEHRSARSMKSLLKGSLMHSAANAGSINVVSLLLLENHFQLSPKAKNKIEKAIKIISSKLSNTKANLNSQDRDGCTPMFLAARKGHLGVVGLLLEYGADASIPNNDRQTPLHVAYRTGHSKIVQMLICRSRNLDYSDDRGKTLLHWAAGNDDLETVKVLLSQSVNVEIQDAVGWTPLHFAVDSGCLEIVKAILACSPNVNTPDESGRTPLHWNALSGRVEIAKLLIDHRASLDALDNDRCTPLHLSFTYRNLDVTNLLISHSANLNIPNAHGQNLLHVASKKGDLPIVKILLDHSANVNMSDKHGWTPLHFATANGYCEVVNLLIRQSANVNTPTHAGQTALLMAARSGHVASVKMLLAHSAVQAADKHLQTPLILASKHGHLEVAEMLIERYANVNAMDEDGWTALHYAVNAERTDLVELLVGRGARVTVQTRDGVTPIDLALSKGNKPIRDLLDEKTVRTMYDIFT